MNFDLWTAHSREECLECLGRISEAPRWINDPFRGDRPPLLKVEKKGEILLWRARCYNNSLQPVLHLRLNPEAGGTRLLGRFEISPVNFWILAAWYAVLFYVLFFMAPPVEADPGVMFRFGLNTGLAMGAPALVWAVGTFLARGEKAFVMDVVKEGLNRGSKIWEDKAPEGRNP